MSEVKGRYQFTLDTPSGYYDQVVGMSQGIINKSFKAMFDQVKGIAKMGIDARDKGSLDCILDAPSVLIIGNTTSTAEIYYQLKIKTGFAILPSERKVALDGWVFTIQTPLKEVTLNPTDQDTPQIKAEKEEAMKTLGKTYEGFKPGDYSVQRIFCALASARWYEPEGVWSTCGLDDVTKKPVSYMDWKKRPENETDSEDLMELLRVWATKQKDKRLSSLGIKFELDKQKLNAPDPTFRPVSVFTQVYPYRSNAFPNGTNGTGTYGEGGKMVPGDYNCLTYCEIVDSAYQLYEGAPLKEARPLPSELKLNRSANLAQPASDGLEIPGTFAMDHHVWLDYFLLPQLQELCSATQMWCGQAERRLDSDGSPAMWPKYAIGCALDGEESKPATHADFKFKAQGPRHYQWTQHSASYSPPYFYKTTVRVDTVILGAIEFDIPKGFNDTACSSKTEVNLRWDAGSDTIRVNGSIYYDFTTRFASDSAFQNDRHERAYTFQGTWSLSVVLTDPLNGVMEPKIHGINISTNFPNDFEIKVLKDENSGTIGRAKECFEEQLRSCISSGIGKVAWNLNGRFSSAGRFVFPGHGALKFTKPRLTEKGGIIAIADYAKCGPDGTVSFPDPTLQKLEPATKPVSATSTFPKEYLDNGIPKLHWNMDFRYNAENKFGRLTFTATNEQHNDPIVFEYIKITLVPPPGTKRCLFNGDKWEKESKTLFEKAAHLFGTAKEGLLSLFNDDEEESEEDEASSTEKPNPADKGSNPTLTPGNLAEGATTTTEKTPVVATSGGAPGSATPSEDPSVDKPATTTSATEAPTTTTPGIEAHVTSTTAPATPVTTKPVKKTRSIFSAGNVYLLGRSEGWSGVPDLEMSVKANKRSLAVDAMITRPDDQPFSVARGESLTIVLQGELDGVGMWPVKVREAWHVEDPEQMGKEVSASDDWKIIEIFADGRKPDYYDISDRQKQATKA